MNDLHLFHGQVHIRNLSPFKDERHLNAVAIVQEFARFFHLRLNVVLIGTETDANAFHLVLLRVGALFLEELFLFCGKP